MTSSPVSNGEQHQDGAAHFDCIVVGAGPAGSFFARRVAQAGFKTGLIERQAKAEIGHPWWDTVRKDIFEVVGLAPPGRAELHRIDANVYRSPSGAIEVHVPASENLYHIDRRAFGRRLIEDARAAGVDIRFETTVAGPILHATEPRVIGVRLEDGTELHAPLVMDASGYRGILRRQLPFATGFDKTTAPEDTFITYREIRAQAPGIDDTVRYWQFGKNKGATWVSFQQPGYVDFFAGRIAVPDPSLPNPESVVETLIEHYRSMCGDEPVIGGLSVPIPIRRALDSFVADGLMLVGDAACQCHPMDGSGVASGLLGAALAAQTAIDALTSGGSCDTAALWPYNVAYHRSALNRAFAFFHILQRFLLPLGQKDVEALYEIGVLDATTFSGTETDAFRVPPSKLLQLAQRGWDRLELLVRLNKAMMMGHRLRGLCRCYPTTADPDRFEAWRREVRACYPPLA